MTLLNINSAPLHEREYKSQEDTEQSPDTILREMASPSRSRLQGILLARLFRWNEWVGLGEVFDSSALFEMPDGETLSASLSWIEKAAWQVSAKSRQSAMPAFVVEFVHSPEDQQRTGEKVRKWLRGGVKLVWVLNTEEEKWFGFFPAGESCVLDGFQGEVNGGEVLPGFRFDLSELRS